MTRSPIELSWTAKNRSQQVLTSSAVETHWNFFHQSEIKLSCHLWNKKIFSFRWKQNLFQNFKVSYKNFSVSFKYFAWDCNKRSVKKNFQRSKFSNNNFLLRTFLLFIFFLWSLYRAYFGCTILESEVSFQWIMVSELNQSSKMSSPIFCKNKSSRGKVDGKAFLC